MRVITKKMRDLARCFVVTSLYILSSNAAMAQNSRPNIILIMADDMGKECLGAYGSTYLTPKLDQLASEGVLFNYAFSQPLCTPSRVQLMTGKYNHKNYTKFGFLNQDQKTFAHLARDAGYATAIVGKWQLGPNNKLPDHFGFDRYCLWQLTQPRRAGERYAKPLIERDGELLETTEDDYGPDIFVDYLLDFVETNKDRPFLAYYPMALVHDPFLPTPASKDWAVGAEARHRADTAYFKDMVAYTDQVVGRIIDKLKALGLYENTVLIFTGDNGTGRRIVTPMRDGSTVPGGKGLTISRGHHVPLVVHWGAAEYPQHVSDDLIDFTDFLPTVADLVGAGVPSEWDADGISFAPQIRGTDGAKRQWIFSHYSPLHNPAINKESARFFRDHRYKLYHDGRFYDLQEDPEEERNIAKGTGTPEGERIRTIFEKEFAKLPPWNPGDPGVAQVVLSGLEPAAEFYEQ